MTILERWRTGNPETVAIRNQEASCHRCVFEIDIRVKDVTFRQCAQGRVHGRKCKSYRETK